MTTRALRARRSCLAVPGSSERFLEKARQLPVDQVFLDLEDSVAPLAKEKARTHLEVSSLRQIAPTFHGDTLNGESTVLDKIGSRRKADRGVVEVETRGSNQDGTVVCAFRRRVLVPPQAYSQTHGGEQPGRPIPRDAPAR